MTYYNTQGDLIEKYTGSNDDFKNKIYDIEWEINDMQKKTFVVELAHGAVDNLTLALDLNQLAEKSCDLLIILAGLTVKDKANSFVFMDFTNVKKQLGSQDIQPSGKQMVDQAIKTLRELDPERTTVIHKVVSGGNIQVEVDAKKVFDNKEDLVVYIRGFDKVTDKDNSYISIA